MTDHRAEAEQLLTTSRAPGLFNERRQVLLAEAQIHATLALLDALAAPPTAAPGKER